MAFLKWGPIIGDGAFREEGAINYWRRHVFTWLQHAETEGVVCIRYEDLILKAHDTINRLGQLFQTTPKRDYQIVTSQCGPTGVRVPKRNCFSGSEDFSCLELRFIWTELSEMIFKYWPEAYIRDPRIKENILKPNLISKASV